MNRFNRAELKPCHRNFAKMLLILVFLGTSTLNCSSKETSDSSAACGNGSHFERDDETYCYYASELIIEGFECPPAVPNLYNGPNGDIICAPIPDLPRDVVDGVFQDWQIEENPPTSEQRTQTELCADPQSFATGTTLQLTGATVEIGELTCTMAGCGPIGLNDAGNPSDMGSSPPQCCNFCTGPLVIECGETTIPLALANESTIDPIQGEVIEETSPELAGLIENGTSALGCIGQQCHEVCTIDPGTDVTLSGRLTQDSGELVFELVDYQQ